MDTWADSICIHQLIPQLHANAVCILEVVSLLLVPINACHVRTMLFESSMSDGGQKEGKRLLQYS